MEMVFLGTGSAWGVPEHTCDCAICSSMTRKGEDRTRTSILFRGLENILLDCGPDVRIQMIRNRVQRPDAILITHEHADHTAGLDDLHAFRRSVPRESWIPIPVYATEAAWVSIEARFGYLVGSLIEKRLVVSGTVIQLHTCRVTPFKTFHGPSAPGSVGYVMEFQKGPDTFKVSYTSDFMAIVEEPVSLMRPDILLLQTHWFNEPIENRPFHMSFQNGLHYMRHWKPKNGAYLVHISDGDHVPGDPANSYLKKLQPKDPLAHPVTGIPYPVPLCRDQWQEIAETVCRDYKIPGRVIIPHDSMVVPLFGNT